jgi:hypothetical protein
MEEYISNIMGVYSQQRQTIESLTTSLHEANNINVNLKEMLELANEKISILNKDIKLKDSRISAYERSSIKSNNVSKKPEIAPPETAPPETAPPKIAPPKSPLRKPDVNVEAQSREIIPMPAIESNTKQNEETQSTMTHASARAPAQAQAQEQEQEQESYENYIIIEMDNSPDETLHSSKECYYIETETRILYLIAPNNVVGEMVGQLKTFKTKAGILYILNNYTNRVYHTNDDNEILRYCGNIVNKKLKLLY